MKYEPYNFDAYHFLMYKAFSFGNYGGMQELLTVRLQGAFEGWSGRTSETWEHQFVVTYLDPHTTVQTTKRGKTLQEACTYILNEIDPTWKDRCLKCFRMCENQEVLKAHIQRNHGG